MACTEDNTIVLTFMFSGSKCVHVDDYVFGGKTVVNCTLSLVSYCDFYDLWTTHDILYCHASKNHSELCIWLNWG